MSCKKHPGDNSSSVGVCASCLRERLISLIASQKQQQHHQPSPLLFPRSVSPCVAHRKSQDQHHLRFNSTPQVGPTHNYSHSCDFSGGHKTHHHHHHDGNNNSQPPKQKGRGKLSLFSTLFRSRSYNLDHPDPLRLSWFSPYRSNNQSTLSSSGDRPSSRVVDRGMSPARGSNSDDDYSSKNTPVGVRRGKKGSHLRNSSSGIGFCLSPLVWASPNRQLHDGAVDSRPRNLSMAVSICDNRSRKLADFGRNAKHR